MDINLDNIALELYGKLQTRFPNVEIGNESGEVLSKKEDIPQARFFEFPYKESGVTLGTITITLDEDDGVVVQVGGDLVDSDVPTIFNFIRSMGAFANKRLLNFKIVNLEKSNLDKRDYEFQAKRKEPEPMEPMMESKMYGTAKISYQDLGETRIVIKHNQPVNTEIAAGRTMHVDSIYVENSQGERFKYPFKHLNGARALAEHIKHGGNPYDPIGKYITGLSEELAQLRKFKGYVGRNAALAEAMSDINSKVFERIEQVKKEVQLLQRTAHYESFAESFEAAEASVIPEATMNDWVDRLTIRTFNEDLKTAFPYIFKLVSEGDIPVRDLNPEDMLSELSKDTLKSYAQKGAYDAASHMHKSGLEAGVKIGRGDSFDVDAPNQQKALKRLRGVSKAINKIGATEDTALESAPKGWEGTVKAMKKHKEIDNPYALANYMKNKGYKSHKEEDAFESFVRSIKEGQDDQDGTNTLSSPNEAVQHAAIEKLNQILASELKGGPGAINAIESLKGIIDDPEFLESLKDLNPDLDTRGLIQQYIVANIPEVAPYITFGDGKVGGEEPVTPPAPLAPPPAPAAPAPEAPVAPAPEASAPAVPAAPAPEAVPPEQVPPAPVAESKQSKSKLKAKFIKAKECGATLDTKMDFGSREMTLRDAIKECGMEPTEIGFDDESNESGVEQILKSIAGFWNKESRNFTIGGTRAKIKIKKAYEDGEFPNATPEDVKAVIAKIDQLDPSGDVDHVVKMADVPQDDKSNDIAMKVDIMKQGQSQATPNDMMKAIIQKLNFGN